MINERIYNPTQRELEILRFLANGRSSKEIANVLDLSVHTVDTHRRNIIKRLHVSNSSEAVMYCVRNGWLGV